jgi:hypothetical protein
VAVVEGVFVFVGVDIIGIGVEEVVYCVEEGEVIV